MRNRFVAGLGFAGFGFGVVLALLLTAGTASALPTGVEQFIDELYAPSLGMVSPGQPLVYDHEFLPAGRTVGDPVQMHKIELAVLLTDDFVGCTSFIGCRYDFPGEGEWAMIEVDGTQIHDDRVTIVDFVLEDVTFAADIRAVGEGLTVSIYSVEGPTGYAGDFAVIYSAAQFTYSNRAPGTTGGGTGGGGNAPIPEPSAAAVFGVGLLVISRRLRA